MRPMEIRIDPRNDIKHAFWKLLGTGLVVGIMIGMFFGLLYTASMIP